MLRALHDMLSNAGFILKAIRGWGGHSGISNLRGVRSDILFKMKSF